MAAKIGSLRADLTLETGRFRAGAADARAQMASLKTKFKADSREIRAAANDMGVGVQSFARDLSALKARLDPASAATAQYRREVELARKALDLGAISGKQYGQAVVQAGQKLTQIRAELKGGVGDGGATKELSADMAALVARLAPAAASLASYRAEAKLLRQAQREGVISTQQFVAGMKEATANYKAAQTQIAAANGAARAGMQQLGMQINDAVTMYAMGAPLAQIFASQSGQATQAVQLMLGTSSKFGAFMAGPWGVAITAGIVVLAALVPKLLETEEAMKDVDFASDGLADAQNILSKVMDLTTGKITTQSQALRDLAKAQLQVAQVKSEARMREAQSVIDSSAQKSFTLVGGMGGGIAGRRERPIEGQIASQFNNGAITASQALDKLRLYRERGLITNSRFEELSAPYANVGMEKANQAAYRQGLKSLAGQGLGSLAQSGKPDKPTKARSPSGKSADEIAANQAREIERLGLEELRAKLDLATTADDRAELSSMLLGAEKEQRYREIDSNKDFSAEQKAAQKAYVERLYGARSTGPNDIVVSNSLYDSKRRREQAQEENRLANDMLSRQADALQSWADIEPNTRERAKLEARALEIQQQIQRNLLEQSIANGDVADADKARALLAQKEAGDRQRLSIQNMTPGQRYQYDLRTSAANVNDAVEEINVRGLQSLNDQLADAIVNFDDLGGVAKNVLKQILADLIRLQIQKAVIGPIAKSLFGAGTSLLGGGGSTSFANAGNFDFSAIPGLSLAGARADGGPVRAGLPYLVGERGPEIVVPGSSGHVIPNHQLANMGGSSVQIVPSPYFDVVVDQRAAAVAAPIGIAAATQGSSAATADVARSQRRRIPGR